jgi:hypothetical protein
MAKNDQKWPKIVKKHPPKKPKRQNTGAYSPETLENWHFWGPFLSHGEAFLTFFFKKIKNRVFKKTKNRQKTPKMAVFGVF